MIRYSIDKDIRTPVIVIIAILSVLILYLIKTKISETYDAPSLFAIFGFSYFIFDKWVWKWPIVIKINGLPNFNGCWKGQLRRVDHIINVEERNIDVEMSITQTWTQISMVLKNYGDHTVSGITRSSTKICGIFIENPNEILLKDVFEFDKAQGSSELSLSIENNRIFLKGHYFSNHPRIGYLELSKISE